MFAGVMQVQAGLKNNAIPGRGAVHDVLRIVAGLDEVFFGVQCGLRREQHCDEENEGGWDVATNHQPMSSLMTVPPNWLSWLKRPAW
jgi:hypothetical protein